MSGDRMREPGEDDPDDGDPAATVEDWAPAGGIVWFVRDRLRAGWTEAEIEHEMRSGYPRTRRLEGEDQRVAAATATRGGTDGRTG